MIVLGLETSCDETGVALFGRGRDGREGVLGHQVYSQVGLHQAFGGVVPEIASRDHVRKALPLVRQVLAEASIDPADIGAVAYTAGPGLMGGLFVGAMLGRSLAYGWGVPALEVHHMEGHLLAPLMDLQPPNFPFVSLLVSGGHSQLVLAKSLGCYELLGDTLDDAVGEVFDKVASVLGLPYPGGPQLETLAAECSGSDWRFPRPMVDRPGLDFSFSGLKTHCRNWCEKLQASGDWHQVSRSETAYAFQEAVVDTLKIKCLRAIKQTGCPRLVVAGGVSANQRLRAVLNAALLKEGAQCWFPAPSLCADNGAMIAYAGWRRLKVQEPASLAVQVKPRWPLAELC